MRLKKLILGELSGGFFRFVMLCVVSGYFRCGFGEELQQLAARYHLLDQLLSFSARNCS